MKSSDSARFWRMPAPLAWLRGRLKGALRRRPKSRRSMPPPRVDAPAAETASVTRGAQPARAERPTIGYGSASSAAPDPRPPLRRQPKRPWRCGPRANSLCGHLRAWAGAVDLKPPSAVREEPAASPAAIRGSAERRGRQGPIRLRQTLRARRPRLARPPRSRRPSPRRLWSRPRLRRPQSRRRLRLSGLAAASAHLSGRDPVQEGRRRGPRGARRGGQ